MSCERHNSIVVVVENAIARGDSAGMERVINRSRWGMDDEPVDTNTAHHTEVSRSNHHITYFEPTDWEAGGENPFRAAIEERRRMITEHPTLFNDWGNV